MSISKEVTNRTVGRLEELCWNKVYANAELEVQGNAFLDDSINMEFLEARSHLQELLGNHNEANRLKGWVTDMRADRQALIDEVNRAFMIHAPFLSGKGI